jgi:Tol biopolymer transport system component
MKTLYYLSSPDGSANNLDVYSIQFDGMKKQKVTSSGYVESYKLTSDGKMIIYIERKNKGDFGYLRLVNLSDNSDININIQMVSYFDVTLTK